MKSAIKLAILGVALGGTALSVATPAQATLYIQYSIGNSGLMAMPQGLSSFGTYGGGVTADDVTIAVALSSNSPGTSTVADVFGNVTTITNSGPTTAVIELVLGSTGFTGPTTPPQIQLSSQVGDTVVTGSPNNTLSYVSCVDPLNNQNNCSDSGVTKTAPVAPPVTGSNSYDSAGDFSLINSLSGTYSITEELFIDIGAGTSMEITASTDLNPVPNPQNVPEPASLFLLGASLVGFGVMRRRRKAA